MKKFWNQALYALPFISIFLGIFLGILDGMTR